MTQPAVSNALKRLRDSVGEDLLTGAARGVAPTAFGEALWPQVRSALGQLRPRSSRAISTRPVDARVFRLTMADAMAAFLLPALMARFARARRALPDRGAAAARPTRASCWPMPTSTWPWAISGSAGGAGGPGPSRRCATAASAKAAVCVMRAGHPLAGAPLTLAAFCAAEHVLVSFSGRRTASSTRRSPRSWLSRRVVLTVNQFFTAAQVVARTDLLTVLPGASCRSPGWKTGWSCASCRSSPARCTPTRSGTCATTARRRTSGCSRSSPRSRPPPLDARADSGHASPSGLRPLCQTTPSEAPP